MIPKNPLNFFFIKPEEKTSWKYFSFFVKRKFTKKFQKFLFSRILTSNPFFMSLHHMQSSNEEKSFMSKDQTKFEKDNKKKVVDFSEFFPGICGF